MPTPRKRKAPKYTLASFEEAEQEADEIPIYTDSKERIPTAADEDNPFITKKSNGRSKAKVTNSIKRNADPESAEMEAAAARDEGIIYTLYVSPNSCDIACANLVQSWKEGLPKVPGRPLRFRRGS
jgi:hypothetical protein